MSRRSRLEGQRSGDENERSPKPEFRRDRVARVSWRDAENEGEADSRWAPPRGASPGGLSRPPPGRPVARSADGEDPTLESSLLDFLEVGRTRKEQRRQARRAKARAVALAAADNAVEDDDSGDESSFPRPPFFLTIFVR